MGMDTNQLASWLAGWLAGSERERERERQRERNQKFPRGPPSLSLCLLEFEFVFGRVGVFVLFGGLFSFGIV